MLARRTNYPPRALSRRLPSTPGYCSLQREQAGQVEHRQKGTHQSPLGNQLLPVKVQGSRLSLGFQFPVAWAESIEFWRPLRLFASPLRDLLTENQPSNPKADSAVLTATFPVLHVEQRVLGNGARLIAVANDAAPVIVLSAVIRAGAVLDPGGREGMAVFVARMLDRGTRTLSAARLSSELEKLESRYDAQTGYLGSVVNIEGPSRNWRELLTILCDIIQHSAFTQFEMESVRSALLMDLQETEADADRALGRALQEKIYPSGHPFKRLVTGDKISIQAIRLTELDAFYRKNYRPDRFSLIVSGDIPVPQIFDATEKLFLDWRSNETAAKGTVPEIEMALDSSNKVVSDPRKNLCTVGFGLPGVGAQNPDFLAVQLANYILGSGRSSRLAQRVREQEGLTDFIESGYMELPGEGPLSIRAKVAPEKLDRLVSAIRSEVERFQKDGISSAEIENAKKGLTSAYWVRLRSNRGVAREFVFSEMNQLGQDFSRSYPELIAAVSRDQVIECLHKYLNFNLGPKVIVGPYEGR
jgi:zinc protease